MFTGLIAEVGTIQRIDEHAAGTRIRVAAPTMAARLRLGDSIAVSGVCLTALAITPVSFEADLARETVLRTSLSRLQPGCAVNLELPTPAGTPLGGHVVQGHVDGVGTLQSLAAVTQGVEGSDWVLEVNAPGPLSAYIVDKGSITIEGISLTVAAAARRPGGGTRVTVAVIPHTYAATNLHTLRPGDEVNLEVDVLAKYAEQRRAASGEGRVTEFSLIAAGY